MDSINLIALASEILEPFDVLLESKLLPSNVPFAYTKWLRFYWDLCCKYQYDLIHADSLPQDKQQSEQQRQQAHQAVSQFYAVQAPDRNPARADND